MVFTPSQRPDQGSGGMPSPLILASQPPSATSATSAISAASTASSSAPPPLRRFSTSSFSKLSDFRLDLDDHPHPEPSRQQSYSSIHSNSGSLNGDENGVKGVRYVDLSLDPGEWRHPVFKKKVLAVLRRLRVSKWESPDILPSYLHLQKVSGALTNAVFFVSFNPSRTPTSPSMSPLLTPTMPPSDPDLPLSPAVFPPTLLLRIYGPSSDALISRTEELRILHVLSSQYGLGPTVFGTFVNGRVEQFFPSRALTPNEMRDRVVSRGIARRMRELHSVDLRALGYDKEDLKQPTVWKCINEWIPAAREVLTTLSQDKKWETWVERVGLHKLPEEVERYQRWVEQQGESRLVFSHNDTQYGNILLLEQTRPNAPSHHKYIVIDFEYAAPNPRGYDIANHFHEWRANYHCPTHSHSLRPHHPFPSPEQRENFYKAYLSVVMDAEGEEFVRREVDEGKVKQLEIEVMRWKPAASAFWALWGLIQAEEQVKILGLEGTGEGEEVEFDYLKYAQERLEMFREDAAELGVWE